MLISSRVNNKCGVVCIKARSPPASPAFIGQMTKPTTVKWHVVWGRASFARSHSPTISFLNS